MTLNGKASLTHVLRRLPVALIAAGLPAGALAAASGTFASEPLDARLLVATDSVAPGSSRLSAGLQMELGEGWKTYWRSPGEVGLPPEIDWSGSENVASVQFLWPAPKRFEAFGIENYGYAGEVVFPLEIALERPGEPALLRADVSALVCSEICVPSTFALELALPAGSATLDPDAAALIADFAARVPDDGGVSGFSVEAAALDEASAVVVQARAVEPFETPDVFLEAGATTAFGAPDIRLSRDGRTLWARTPVTAGALTEGAALGVTLVDGPRAASFKSALGVEAPPPPEGSEPPATERDRAPLGWTLGLAFLGGLILNAMPCVLPVLSMKLGHAVGARDRTRAEVRAGFLATAAGIVVSMWVVAAATLAAREAGLAVGWGLQFQNPWFLVFMAAVTTLFAANLAGLFEIPLPAGLATHADAAARRGGRSGDFAHGVFAALLATPCSAPFLGAAVAFALTGGPADITLIFTALGLGLAAPYLAVAAAPGAVRALPKPGRWTARLKAALGLLLLVTTLWLLWVLQGVTGPLVAGAAAASLTTVLLLLALRRVGALPGGAGLGVAVAASVGAALAAPVVEPARSAGAPAETSVSGGTEWVAFDRGQIARRVSRGETVLVDVTADWCLTCKANKALVLDRDPVAALLRAGEVVPMRADWTRPNEAIARYLAEHDRYGIPFNAVYGPAAPKGIVLPEILSAETVLDAVTRAGRQGAVAVDG